MKPGTQIAYLPTHVNGNINHHDVEFGFVTSQKAELGVHYCRYWIPASIGTQSGMPALRTVANSEATPDENIIAYESVPQIFVDKALEEIAHWRARYTNMDLRTDGQ